MQTVVLNCDYVRCVFLCDFFRISPPKRVIVYYLVLFFSVSFTYVIRGKYFINIIINSL